MLVSEHLQSRTLLEKDLSEFSSIPPATIELSFRKNTDRNGPRKLRPLDRSAGCHVASSSGFMMEQNQTRHSAQSSRKCQLFPLDLPSNFPFYYIQRLQTAPSSPPPLFLCIFFGISFSLNSSDMCHFLHGAAVGGGRLNTGGRRRTRLGGDVHFRDNSDGRGDHMSGSARESRGGPSSTGIVLGKGQLSEPALQNMNATADPADRAGLLWNPPTSRWWRLPAARARVDVVESTDWSSGTPVKTLQTRMYLVEIGVARQKWRPGSGAGPFPLKGPPLCSRGHASSSVSRDLKSVFRSWAYRAVIQRNESAALQEEDGGVRGRKRRRRRFHCPRQNPPCPTSCVCRVISRCGLEASLINNLNQSTATHAALSRWFTREWIPHYEGVAARDPRLPPPPPLSRSTTDTGKQPDLKSRRPAVSVSMRLMRSL
ncbi:unnamed protein product [Pleuronectes platessa]|uniref:Uncharacterized protein n=1 Tax=Pleuronectes platessa TaxID=8262 RepID=A0A9N7W1J6_PLEPL|nr:unnamed protein product [Pleuronectes platessa]